MDIFEDEIEMLENIVVQEQDVLKTKPGKRSSSRKKFIKKIYGQKIRNVWFRDPRLKDWLIESPEHDGTLSCKYCKGRLTSKIYVLLKHRESKTHLANLEYVSDNDMDLETIKTKPNPIKKKNESKKILEETFKDPLNISLAKFDPQAGNESTDLLLKFNTDACRVCLKSEGTISLFDDDSSIEKFRFITFLEASKDDGLPQSLCVNCNTRLKIAHAFKTQAISSQTQLKKYLKNINQSFAQISSSTTQEEHDDLLNDIETLNTLMDPEDKFKIETLFKKTKKNKINNSTYKNVSEVMSLHCSICDTEFSNRSNLNRHQRLQHGFDPYTDFLCDLCGKTFDSKDLLEEHSSIHKPHDNFPCSICGIRFQRKSTLRMHMQTHKGNGQWSCKLCHDTFYEKQDLLTHLHQKHNKLAIIYKCNSCNIKFNKKQALIEHKINVHGEESSEHFEELNELSNNKVFHVTKKSTDIKSEFYVNKHENNENDGIVSKKSHQCVQCDEAFTNMEDLFEHLKIHMKRYNCIFCSEVLLSKKILKSHIYKSHHNEAQNINLCCLCNIKFADFDLYYDHMLNNHPNNGQ